MNERVSARLVGLTLCCVGLATAAAVAPVRPDQIERWFSLGVYPWIQQTLTPLSNRLPAAVLDCLVVLAVIGCIWTIWTAVRAARRMHRLAPLWRAGLQLVAASAVAYLLFLGLWGLNYRRLPMQERLVLAGDVPSSEDVMDLGLRAVRELNALHGEAGALGWGSNEWQDAAFVEAFGKAQRMLSDAPSAVPGRLKQTMFGPYFRWTLVDGMVNPFGLEVLANPDLLPFERPFVAAHEWAHLAGYADESEASFVGWLTCLHGTKASRYSGWLYLYWQIYAEVAAEDRAQLLDALGPGPRADIEAMTARLRRGQFAPLSKVSWRVYDQYLKANRVDAGVRSYGAVVTLILRTQFDSAWVPTRKRR